MFIQSFIKIEPQLEPYRCYRCNQISLSILQQNCACRKYICSPCMQRFSFCTYCHQPLTGSHYTQPRPVKFLCPSRSQSCNLTLTSVGQLLQHSRKCIYVKQQLRKEMAQIADYQCLQGHQLSMNNSYGKCTVCGIYRHCKSQCMVCSQKDSNNISYCIACRPIRCTKNHCPTGHPIHKRAEKSGANCDICGIVVSKVSGVSYSYPNCDFDICSNCYFRLPETLEPLPSPTQMIAK